MSEQLVALYSTQRNVTLLLHFIKHVPLWGIQGRTCTHTFTHLLIHTCSFILLLIHPISLSHTHTHTHTQSHTHVHSVTHTHTLSHIHMYTQSHTRTHSVTYTCTHTHIHTHTLTALMFIVSLLFSPSPIIPLRPLQSPGISKEELAEMERQDHETLAEIERQVSEVLYIIQLIGTVHNTAIGTVHNTANRYCT